MAIIDPVAALTCLMFIAVLVVVLNAVSLIITVKSRNFSQSTDHPLLWLLAANILIGLFPLPIYALKKSNFRSIQVSGQLCDAWRYTYFTTIHLAMTSLIVMTLEKIIRLTYPLRSESLVNKYRINLALVILWIFFIFFDMIPFFPIDEQDDEYCHYVVKKKWAVAMNIITMVIPVPIIIFTYAYMMHLAYKQALSIRTTSTVRKRKQSAFKNFKLAIEIKATRTVAYIVGSYLLCWLPSTFYYLLEWLCPHCYPKDYEPHKTWIRFFFKLLVMVHALVTPIVFCWQRTGFRTDARRVFRKFLPQSVSNFKHSKDTVYTVSNVKHWKSEASQTNSNGVKRNIQSESGSSHIYIHHADGDQSCFQSKTLTNNEGSIISNNNNLEVL